MEHLAPAPSQLGAGATDKPMLTCDEDLPTKIRRPAAAAGGHHPPPDACFDCNICLDFAADPVVTLCGHLYCWPCIYKWLRVPDAQFDPATADFDAAASSAPRNQQCPVCKAALSESALVPLYGRGGGGGNGKDDSPGSAAAAALPVPRRPLPSMLPLREDPSFNAASHPTHHHHHQQQQRDALSHTHAGHPRQVGRDYLGSVMSSTTVAHPLFHGVAMLPFLLFCDNAGAGSSSGMYYADPYYNTRRGVAERRHERNSARSLQRVSCFLFLCVLLCLLLF